MNRIITKQKNILMIAVLTAITLSILVAASGCDTPQPTLKEETRSQPAVIQEATSLYDHTTANPPSHTAIKQDNRIKFSDITVIEDITIDVPAQLDILDCSPVVIDTDTMNAFINNLEVAGWSNHKLIATDIDGLYFIASDHMGKGFSSESSFHAAVDRFMKDSGLKTFLNANGFTYSNRETGEQVEYSRFYWLDYDGHQSNSYIRINLEDDRTCGECKIYLCQSDLFRKVDSIPFEQAMEHAFMINKGSSDDANYKFKVNSAEIEYVNGLPYYCFHATGMDVLLAVEGYAPAISYNEIMSDESLYSKYLNFTN